MSKKLQFDSIKTDIKSNWRSSFGERPAIVEPIYTQFINPPIPIRNYDWCAYRDPEKFTGYGKTELEAIKDLLENEGDFE